MHKNLKIGSLVVLKSRSTGKELPGYGGKPDGGGTVTALNNRRAVVAHSGGAFTMVQLPVDSFIEIEVQS
jgi:hypothetical protein